MKTTLPCLLLVALIGGCLPPYTVQLKAPCSDRTKADVLGAMATVLVSEGFAIDIMNEAAGLLQASKGEGAVTSDQTVLRRWSFTISADTVYAYPRTLDVTKGGAVIESSGPIVADDELPRRETWYWSVRDQLEKQCGAPIVFVTRERTF